VSTRQVIVLSSRQFGQTTKLRDVKHAAEALNLVEMALDALGHEAQGRAERGDRIRDVVLGPLLDEQAAEMAVGRYRSEILGEEL
jgi:hypothetical protein